MTPGTPVKITGLARVEAITEGGLVRIGGRLFHDSGVEMKHEPGPRARFEVVLEGEMEKRKGPAGAANTEGPGGQGGLPRFYQNERDL